jgi:hypothetical protein
MRWSKLWHFAILQVQAAAAAAAVAAAGQAHGRMFDRRQAQLTQP